VFLQFVVETPEGQRYKTFYQVESLPHISIIDPRTGERVKQWHYGPEPAEFVVDLMDFIEANSLAPEQKGPKKQRTTAIDLTEDEQIAAAIQASILFLSLICRKTVPLLSSLKCFGELAHPSMRFF
jgi:hypothetical protein